MGKVNPKKNGSVSVIFPKEAEALREDVKLIMVNDARVCHWNKNLGKWSNERYDSSMADLILNCDPIDFIVAAYDHLTASEHCSAVMIMGPDGRHLQLDEARQLDFRIQPSASTSTSRATIDDIQSDLRIMQRLLCLVAKKAGISE